MVNFIFRFAKQTFRNGILTVHCLTSALVDPRVNELSLFYYNFFSCFNKNSLEGSFCLFRLFSFVRSLSA